MTPNGYKKIQDIRLSMLFIPTLPIKVEFAAMLRMLGQRRAKGGRGADKILTSKMTKPVPRAALAYGRQLKIRKYDFCYNYLLQLLLELRVIFSVIQSPFIID